MSHPERARIATLPRTAWPAVGLLSLALVAQSGGPSPPRSGGAPREARVLLVSVDGLRPDLVLRVDSPALRSLMRRGSFSLWAMTAPAAVTLPSHTSMLTGVPPSKHGIDWNTDLPLARPVYPSRPTLFEVAKNAGYTTAMVAGKAKFSALAKPGTLDWSFVPATTTSDSAVADTAVLWIATCRPQVMFVHLPGVDMVGHAEGWGSHAQLAAVAAADRAIGRMLAALRAQGLLDRTVVLVTADHGGAGRTHGPDDPRSREIPWIIAGPGVREDYDLTQDADLTVRTEDTFATLSHVLGILVTPPVDGRAVMQAFADSSSPAKTLGASGP